MKLLKYLVLLTLTSTVHAQSSNSHPCGDGSGIMPVHEKAIGICNLDTQTHTLPAEGSKIIPFSIRSCWADWTGNEWVTAYCRYARSYTLEVRGNGGGDYFWLSGPGGNIPMQLSFLHPASGSVALRPNTESTRFEGAANGVQTPVELLVTIPEGVQLQPGTYRGDFDFYLYQCNPWGDPNNPWNPIRCKDSNNSSQRTELYPPISFTIQIGAEAQIRISGLEDMEITPSTSGNTDAEQNFCVYTSGGANFDLRAQSTQGSGEFTLRGSSGMDTINYKVHVKSLQPPVAAVWLQEGIATTGGRWQGSSQENCADGENMQLLVRIPTNEIADPIDSRYSDTLTLTVELQ
ncbi:hypothetical protein [Microbulbifer thermotolerans]|uniref:hypothetical protein n=1 Tax=Microbulbifer thermotolerans TaxID=252514 RepID=UPI00224B7EBB|nr:hypothetical protein [Microbulbifer thermotolerans]MCX2780140.1 hypothetical protein [Microbulbifer thermotolerans]MCX2805564.1 hypothetical protein [Microbulbifer thermotolerans]